MGSTLSNRRILGLYDAWNALLFSSYVLRDSFAELASLTILLASVVSIVGRNYASAKAVVLMSACTLIPVLAGLILAGTPFHVVIGLLLIPYFCPIFKWPTAFANFCLQR